MFSFNSRICIVHWPRLQCDENEKCCLIFYRLYHRRRHHRHNLLCTSSLSFLFTMLSKSAVLRTVFHLISIYVYKLCTDEMQCNATRAYISPANMQTLLFSSFFCCLHALAQFFAAFIQFIQISKHRGRAACFVFFSSLSLRFYLMRHSNRGIGPMTLCLLWFRTFYTCRMCCGPFAFRFKFAFAFASTVAPSH